MDTNTVQKKIEILQECRSHLESLDTSTASGFDVMESISKAIDIISLYPGLKKNSTKVLKSYYPDHYVLSVYQSLLNAINRTAGLVLDKTINDIGTAISLLQELQD
jgi:prefoldin subunit 5